jgi:hypothetical protein
MTTKQDMRIYMVDEDDYEYEVDMALMDEVGYLTGVYTEGPKIGEEFILDNDQQFDAETLWKEQQESH